MVRTNKFEQFLLLFDALKKAANGSPQRLKIFYEQSETLKRTAEDLSNYLERYDFERRVFHGTWEPSPEEDTNKAQGKYHARVPIGFERACKEYKNDWETAITEVICDLSDLSAKLDNINLPLPDNYEENDELRAPDPRYEDDYDPTVHDGGAAFNSLLQLAIEQLDRDPDWEDVASAKAHIGLSSYDYLENTIGISISEIFRRWRMVPVIFMPSNVSDRYSLSEGKKTLFNLLDDAVKAFIAGSYVGALATCRAIFEMVLKGHYDLDLYE